MFLHTRRTQGNSQQSRSVEILDNYPILEFVFLLRKELNCTNKKTSKNKPQKVDLKNKLKLILRFF